jgi:hypothetical protein
MSAEHEPTEHELRNRLRLRGYPRIAAVLLWSSFLGGSVTLLALLMLPEGWFDEPMSRGRLTCSFAIVWLLALVPAVMAAALLLGPEKADGR